MVDRDRESFGAPVICMLAISMIFWVAQADAQLPKGVKVVWDLEKAYREKTSTRERICLNGLWRWQPAKGSMERVPDGKWGYFKVPGPWPGIMNYIQKESQRIYLPLGEKEENLRDIKAAWYEREITIPVEWAGRRISLSLEYLNSYSMVFIDGRKTGEIRFPGGEVDLTPNCRVGKKHVLSLLVIAMPLKKVVVSYHDTVSVRKMKGSVARRGLCGDVFLVSLPSGAHIADLKVDTSIRKAEITFHAVLQNIDPNREYSLRARIMDKEQCVAEFTSKSFNREDLKDNRISFKKKWKPEKLWDIHTPHNIYHLQIFLLEGGGREADISHVVRFGFRELWIEGRDFYLNGTRIFLSSVPLDNAQVGAAFASYRAARETLLRLKIFGINFVYTHNYGCEPGAHLGFAEILTAADDVGMLVSFSQPHFGHYEWQKPGADQNNGYVQHAKFYVRAAQNHPSVVMYSMSHNATDYDEDMNPDMIDGLKDPRDRRALKNAHLALRAEAIVRDLDPSRIVYHHSSGNLGSMHTINFYPNFAPIQEISDWFEHWATKGVKPLFTCEYGAPLIWDWTMYRGWYQGKRAFGQAKVPWEFCLAEWNSQFLGDRAFQISEMEKTNLRWEARQFRAGNLWHHWDYPHMWGPKDLGELSPIFAMYLNDNWRAFRTWGVSVNSPWDFGLLWKLRDGIDKTRKEFKVDWDILQRPGFNPDYVDERLERMDIAYDRSDWIPTEAALTLIRNNKPLLAYLGGKPERFTSKDHNYYPGEKIEKQLIIINNSRETVNCNCNWSFGLPQTVNGSKIFNLRTGMQMRIPLKFDLPTNLPVGSYRLRATVKFNNAETQDDSIVINVLPRNSSLKLVGRIAVFDPLGETSRLLKAMDIEIHPIDANSDLSAYDILIVGKAAITVKERAPDITRVHNGLKVIIFEQTTDVLEKRLGFRVTEYGLRRVFKRVPDHPIFTGITPDHLRDWRGAATILPPRLQYKLSPRYEGAPSVRWCDIEVTRVWRCGNYGNVASVLIEKPGKGDFLPISDGGFSLQYSPLMEYREGKGMILFCQMDVTGRTETEPAAELMVQNILKYVANWEPTVRRKASYVGDAAGRNYLEAAGFFLTPFENRKLSADQALIVGPGGGYKLFRHGKMVEDWLKDGGTLLLVGMDENEANALLPWKVRMKKEEHISAFFESPSKDSLLSGVGPADTHNREPRVLPLIAGGAVIIGNGIVASAENARVVFCQLVPWQFEYQKQFNLKKTYRRASFLIARLLGNMGVSGSNPLIFNFQNPLVGKAEKRWLNGMYLDSPEEWDDPYRFFRW